MKKLTLVLSIMIALVGLNANAALYIVGDGPLGGWTYNGGNEMFDQGNGNYTYNMTIAEDAASATVYFVFADGQGTDWDDFNGNYRIGPTSGDQKVTADTWVNTQKAGGDNGAYFFQGTKGQTYTVSYDASNSQFKVEGYVEPILTEVYTVAGSSASLFGTEWDPSNEANNMTLVDGLYTWSKENVVLSAGSFEFKVTVNHEWAEAYPSSNYYVAIDEDGLYNVKITFNAETKDVNCELTLIDPILPDLRGDVNGDHEVNIADVTNLIEYLLNGQTPPEAADCNMDGGVNIADVTTLINFLLTNEWPAVEMVYTIAGVESVFGSNWDPTDENNNMVKGANGVYTWSKTGVALTGNFEFKIVGNHDWAAYEWPIGEGNNYVANVAEEGIYTIDITFNPEAEEADRITCTLTKTGDIEHTYTVAGIPSSLFGSEWDAENDSNDMIKGEDGLYTWTYQRGFEAYVATAFTEVQFKIVQDHDWNKAWPENNYVTAIGQDDAMTLYFITITFNPETKEVTFTSTIPEMPNE